MAQKTQKLQEIMKQKKLFKHTNYAKRPEEIEYRRNADAWSQKSMNHTSENKDG